MPDGAPPPPPDPEREIEREVARAGLTRDPLGPVAALFLRGVRAISDFLTQFAEIEARLRGGRTPEERREEARELARLTVREVALLRPWIVAGACGLSALAGAGAVGVAWWLAPARYAGLTLDRETIAVIVANGGTLAPALASGRDAPQPAGTARAIVVWTEAPRAAVR